MLKITLKFILKVLLHVSLYIHHQGAYCLCSAKVITVNTVSYKT